MTSADFLGELESRGLLYQVTDREGFAKHLATGSRSVYGGFDPTGDSLTIGNLVPLLLLRRYQLAGHRPYALVGGGTGLIGDPSGKDAERAIRDRADVQRNVAGVRRVFEQILDFSGSHGAVLVDNADWLEKLTYIEVLRDVGKHFSVNMMIQKDSVRERLQNREQGISYTEFSYMLLQAYDFLHLYRAHGVTAQVAGSDQWGNTVAGIDLIRRTERAETYGMTVPLITKADGGKFGKTESGAVWLSAERTSPYEFYQFWLNASDPDAKRFLHVYTLLSLAEIAELVAAHDADPSARVAQRALAARVTELVHGADGLKRAEAATQALFSGDVRGLGEQAVKELFANAPAATLPRTRLATAQPIVELLVDGGVVKSKREAREFLEQGAISVNGERASGASAYGEAELLFGQMLLVRRGKKSWHVIRFA
ncbi:MAG TPA: tyrosine--tRNA ligase [Polyangiaceae bacterium]|nr:tyrosine--tRNA ligase [Polyangiaceae bacterium]